MIRKLKKEEFARAADLSYLVCMECGIQDFTEEGIQTFKDFVYNKSLMGELTLYGAVDNHIVIGVLGVHAQKKHISLFFILPSYHRKGIGKLLFNSMLEECKWKKITVNSSTYAVPFYTSLGFKKIGEKVCVKGITSVPMIKE